MPSEELEQLSQEILAELENDNMEKEAAEGNAKKKVDPNKTKFWHDRFWSSMKDGIIGGIPGSIVGSAVGSKFGPAGQEIARSVGSTAGMTASSLARLNKLHKEGLGEKPDAKDIAKIVGKNALVSGAGIAAAPYMTKKLVGATDEILKGINNPGSAVSQKAMKDIGKAMAVGAPIGAGAYAAALTNTPESIVKKKLRDKAKSEKTASEILDELFAEKLASIQE